MAAPSFDDLFRAVRKGEVPPAIYLYGAEDVLKDELVREVTARVVDPGLRDFNFDTRSAAQLDAEAVETLCTTLPMMADRRLVVIRDIEAWGRKAKPKAAVLRYLEKPGPETVLVLVQGAGESERDADLARKTAAVEVERLPLSRVEKWLAKRAEERGVALEPDALAHLARAVDGELGPALSELDKLAGLAGEREGVAISVEQVASLLGVRRGETQFDWRDAVLEDQTGRAAAMLPHVLAQPGVSGVGLLSLLGTSLVGLSLARAHYDQGKRGGALHGAIKASLIKTRPPRLSYDASAAEWARLAPVWPCTRVNAAIRAALVADRRLKGTALSDERGVLVDLVMELAVSREVAA